MADLGVYTIASEDIVFESFDGDAVVLDVGTGRYFGFSDLGSCVWEALLAGVPASAIVGLGLEGSRIDADDLAVFVDRLREYGLIIAQPEKGGETLPASLSERFASARERLSVESHDELADLIQADPIHDVEETMGWPVVREAS